MKHFFKPSPLSIRLGSNQIEFEHSEKLISFSLDESLESSFKRAMKILKPRLYSPCQLTLSKDECVFTSISLASKWKESINQPIFIREVMSELSHEYEHLNQYFMDVRILEVSVISLEVQVVLLHKNKLKACLIAIKKSRLKLDGLYVEGEPFNLLDWRGRAYKKNQIKIALRLFIFPIFSCIGLFFLNSVHDSSLLKVQTRFDQLVRQYNFIFLDYSSLLLLSDLTPIIQNILDPSRSALGIQEIRLDEKNSLFLSGSALIGTDLNAYLDDIAHLKQVEKGLNDPFEVEVSDGRLQWKGQFLVREQKS